MAGRKRCVLKAVFEKGFRIYYFDDSVDYMVYIYQNETAKTYLMICDKELIIEVPDDDLYDEIDNNLGHPYASISFIRSHQKEYEDVSERYGYKKSQH